MTTITKQTIDEICRRLSEDQTLSEADVERFTRRLQRMASDEALKQELLFVGDDSPRTLFTLDRDKSEHGPVSGETANFERFWAAVWHKTGKDAARRAWLRVPKNKRELVVQQAVIQGPLIMQRSVAQGITPIHPATWLNQGRFNDDADALRVYTQPGKQNARMSLIQQARTSLMEVDLSDVERAH